VIEVRSYRRVFDLERRIYRIDHLRLNPGGVPVRGVVYLLALLAALGVLTHVPLVGPVVASVPWYLLDIAAPLLASALLTMIRLEGRPFHLAALAALRSLLVSPGGLGLQARPRYRDRWHPQAILVLPDGTDGRVRSMRFDGPGAVVVAVEHRPVERWRPIRVRFPGRRRPRDELLLSAHGDARALGEREVIWLGMGTRLHTQSAYGSDDT
jgi:hypothetical protein